MKDLRTNFREYKGKNPGDYLEIYDLKNKNKRHRFKLKEKQDPEEVVLYTDYVRKIARKGKKLSARKYIKDRIQYTRGNLPEIVKKEYQKRKTRLTKYKPLEKQIKKGWEKQTTNRYEATNNPKEVYKRLLRPLVPDEEFLNILTEEQNMQKMAHRIHQTITIEGDIFEQNKHLQFGQEGIIAKTGLTLRQLTTILNEELPNDTDINRKSNRWEPIETIAEKHELNYDVNMAEGQHGIVKNLKWTIEFRKAI